MKYVSGRIVWGIYTWLGWSGEVAQPIGSSVLVRAHYFLLVVPLPRSNPTRYKYPTQSFHWHTSFTCLLRWNRQWVPKRRQLKLKRRGISQKGTNYNIKLDATLAKLLTASWKLAHKKKRCIIFHFPSKWLKGRPSGMTTVMIWSSIARVSAPKLAQRSMNTVPRKHPCFLCLSFRSAAANGRQI